ncbi:ankyrin repeat domain-containing protein 26-like isoform X4 [Rattus norvegicus]|uniref:ankyrin repeat domain-containing protein 26-like isoform X4 n=1 Tax=Rattus norvegicus TaxID=10116 RepID=UPI0004E47FBC|nr:ankyrin repeat domain-containing protein 26-like isoform X4 [Rattus norvegicus]|eukprot:XP_008768827.1 PREDICTED: ankyrin repeat domain-containing protein 26-like isoform X3 [Rattus norvegicus]
MRRIFWSRRRRPRPSITGYCAVGQLHRAASVGAVATVERFLTFRLNGVNDTDKRNRTALHYACAHGHLGVVTLLIERNCNVNARDDDKCTPLIKASQHQREDCVAVLLQHGADPNAVDALGNTALHYAVHSENASIASQLLEHSANIEARTKEGFTPLSLAVQQNRGPIVELLIEKGANKHTVFRLDRSSCRFGPDGSSRKKDDSNVDIKDEAALKTSIPRQKASKARQTNLQPDHLRTTSQEQKEKRKCDTGHRPAHSGRPPMKTAEEAQQSKQLTKVLRSKLRTFLEPSEKEPPPSISTGKAHSKDEEERKYRLQELDVALENSDDRTVCTVASASAAAAAVSASTSAESASTSASAASRIASAAFASASAASASASVAFASASAASTSAASASASASEASAAAAAASISAYDASAAAAAAAAASAATSSNTTVNAVVAAAVTAAFVAVAATAEHKGDEPIPQRHSGATNDRDFVLKEKEEQDKSEPATHLMEINRSENKNSFPGDSMPTFETCTADTSAMLQVKQSCARELHQDDRRYAKNTSKEKHEVKKLKNFGEGLEDGTLPCEAASDDYRDSGCLLGLWDELYLCKRLLEIKNSYGDVLRREIKKMETKHGGVRKELSKITEVLSQPERQETEWGELCNLRSSLKQNENIINDGCFDGKMKTELRGRERQYHEEFGRSPLYHQCNEEFEVGQHEMSLGNLNMNLKALHDSVTQLQEAQLQDDPQREGVLSSARMAHLLWKLEVDCLKLEDSVKNQAEEIEELETQLLTVELTGDRKKERDEVTRSTQSLACALEHEVEKIEELEKTLHGFMEVMKIAGKKLDECENRELYFYEDMRNRTFETLQHETQAEEEKKLEKARENNNDSRMSQIILRVKSLESRLPEIKSHVDSTRREMEKHKQLYVEENKSRKSLFNTLSKTVEKLEVSRAKLMQLNQQKMTMETILSSLPAQQSPLVAKFNPAVGHNPSSPDAPEPQSVCESVRKGLSRRQMGLVKHKTGEDSAPVDPWSFEASPL